MGDDKFIRNWKNLKPLILKKWDKLKESDLENIQPIKSEIVEAIQKKHQDFPKAAIGQDLENMEQQILKNAEE